ncbi:hypothetical protein [Gulosibacter faecalis]|jgi:hypothetical protein|uniref:Lipoprotein n=1 Tax=Gulosibacter faecalis TaxID=272240 RepID=A0ABW5V059_9MICO|nr:hypothetical protein [Gulosibacter faecalis]
MKPPHRALSVVATLAVAAAVLVGCNVAPPTGVNGDGTPEPSDTHPAPTAISCATVESELAYANQIVSKAAQNFGDDPYATLERIREAIGYIEELRDVAEDVELEQYLNEVAVTGGDLVDTIDRVMQNGTILVEFDKIAEGADAVEDQITNLIDYCRF